MDSKYCKLIQERTRRHFLQESLTGIGSMALASLLQEGARGNSPVTRAEPLSAWHSHHTPKAKRMIFLHMVGGPPHLDLWDYKPELVRRTGQDCPDEFLKGRRFAFTSGTPKLLGTSHRFTQHGQSGTWVSDALPYLSGIADELTVIRSMTTDQFNHAPAELFLYTGSPRMGRPALGSWLVYGLGTENRDLPGFVVLISSGLNPSAGKTVWGSGFLSSVYQGVQCRSGGDPVLYVSDPPGMNRETRRASLDALRTLNEQQWQVTGSDETRSRISQYELAFRMQMSVPEVMDISRESAATLEMYGAAPGESSFANNCLLARRLVEQGVRYVQLFDWGWDFHGTGPAEDVREGLTTKCATVDKSTTALIMDLKQRGLLEDTLVVWGGEFGRTPFREGRTAKSDVMGRDHYPDCFTMFMAGGGTKPGITYGETDELGFQVANSPVGIHDFQATLLHLMGFNHERLTYHYQGRDFRLTDVHGQVIPGLLA